MKGRQQRDKRERRSTLTILLVVAVLGLMLLLVLRLTQSDYQTKSGWMGTETDSMMEEEKQQFHSDTETVLGADIEEQHFEEEKMPENSAADQSDSLTAENEIPFDILPASQRAGYTSETWQMVSDLVTIYRNRQEGGNEEIRALLSTLKLADPALGILWEQIMSFWSWVNTDFSPNTGVLKADLPQDNSLCVLVLGYQLMQDGSMAPELLGRCETALNCLNRYPNAWLAVTGGGTAAGDRSATEADVMAEWFIRQGIALERIIIENRSLTTVENAENTCAILAEHYPEIKTLLLVSSDYHIRLGALLFQTAAYLYSYTTDGEAPYHVAANSAYPTAGNASYESVSMQAQDLWVLTDPHY